MLADEEVGRLEERLPEEVVVRDDEPAVGREHFMQALEPALAAQRWIPEDDARRVLAEGVLGAWE